MWLTQAIFVFLKLAGYLPVSWWIVMVPLLVWFVGFLIYIAIHWNDPVYNNDDKPVYQRRF